MSRPACFLIAALLSCQPAFAHRADTPRDKSPEMRAFEARWGGGWSLAKDPRTHRPRQLSGGALPLLATEKLPDEAYSDASRDFIRRNAVLLELEPEWIGPARVVRAGNLTVLHHALESEGLRILDARVSLVLSGRFLLAVNVTGAPLEPIDAAHGQDKIDGQIATARALAESGLAERDLRTIPRSELLLEVSGSSSRPVWHVVLTRRSPPARFLVRLDARQGALLSVTDETVEACAPSVSAVEGRVLGGVRPESALDDERIELMPFATVGPNRAGVDGIYATPLPPFAAHLSGETVSVSCTDCTSPNVAGAPSLPDGSTDFGLGGIDEVGNDFSTPAGRSTYFHVDAARRLATRWSDQAFLGAPLTTRVNIDSACNANWDGSGLNFFRSSPSCGNTGEIRDVISHEWGHAFDDHDGLPSSRLSVDAATGEAVGDTIAILRSRDACIGEGFFDDPGRWPSDACSGVRDLDEFAVGHRRGAPATLTLDNVTSLCPPSAYYRGPLGREGHCEGELLGQAIWHLARNLQLGASYADGSNLPDDGLSEDAAFEVIEALFFRSRAMLASYAPSTHQGIGMSAYEAFLLADDEGDGIANGTPHAAAIHEAFAHHGLTEPGPAPLDSDACAGPPAPTLTATPVLDTQLGRAAIRLSWNHVGADVQRVLRADDVNDSWLPLALPPNGTFEHVDRGVLMGREYRYRIEVADATDCRTTSNVQAVQLGGPELSIAGLALDDSPAAGGDGDGLFEVGEDATLRVDLLNIGDMAATEAQVSLRSTDPALEVLDAGPIDYGDLQPGITATGPAVFTLRATAGVPRHVYLVVDVESAEGCLRTQVQWESAAPELEIAAERLEDADMDGAWTPGESTDLWIDLKNTGLVDAELVDGTLRFRGAPVPGVTIDSDTASWGTVSAGAVAAPSVAPFQLSAAPGMGPRTKVPLELELRIGGGVHRTHAVDLTVGGFEPGSIDWSWDHTADQLTLLELTPLVLQLTDDNGDGVVTECDVPDVVIFTTPRFGTGPDEVTMRVLSGDDGSQHWELNEPCTQMESSGAQAGGDVDGDGFNEILVGAADESGEAFLCAISHDGAVEWRTTEPIHAASQFTGRVTPQVWDLEGDGDVEIIAGHSAIDGATGAVLWTTDRASAPRSLVTDLDLDGRLEVIHKNFVYDSNGVEQPSGLGDWFGLKPAAVGNLDDDPYPEIAIGTLSAGVRVVHHDGSLLWERADIPAGGSTGPLCLADVDGDGYAELGVPTREVFYMLDHDGSDLWTRPVNDLSGAAGCSLFDFEEDGAPEVIYRDHDSMWVFDGEDGTNLWQTTVRSGTAFEYPVVADVDHDGSAEILVLDGLSLSNVKLRAFGNPTWPRARGIWNQEDYSVTNVGEAGSIPSGSAPRWLTGNDFRAQAQGPDTTCLCNLPQGDIVARHPDCREPLACFDVDLNGGLAPYELSWDFGDGSPPSSEDAPCHAFPGWGSYAVQLEVRDVNGCVSQLDRLVILNTPVSVVFSAEPTCSGEETCYTAGVSGGRADYEITWNFGDGTAAATGPTVCHVFDAGGTFPVTAFAKDADDCLAEWTVDVSVGGVGALPELSASGARPLEVRRAAGANLALEFEDSGLTAGLHAGDLQALRSSGLNHGALACTLLGGTASIAEPAIDTYYIVVAMSECGGSWAEGPFGFDSDSVRRESASELGNATCP